MAESTKPLLLVAIVIGATGYWVGYHAAPREILDSEVKQVGLFSTDTKATLSAAVLSLKAENRLLVYSYKADAKVTAGHSILLGLAEARQLLIVPATVGYYANVSTLTAEDVAYDPARKTLTIRLPKLKLGDVAFEPERATIANAGLLSFSQAQTDRLQRINYKTARAAFVKQAQQPSLVANAEAQARKAVESYFRFAFRLAGTELKGVQTAFVD